MPWLLPGKIAIACADEEDMPTGSQAPHVPIRSKRGKEDRVPDHSPSPGLILKWASNFPGTPFQASASAGGVFLRVILGHDDAY